MYIKKNNLLLIICLLNKYLIFILNIIFFYLKLLKYYFLNNTKMMKKKVIPQLNNYNIDDDILSKVYNKELNMSKKLKKIYFGWRSFAFKDNIINVAFGMIIATSFKNVVNSLVVDIITPCIIGLSSGTDTQNLFIVLKQGNTLNITYITLKKAKDDGAVTLNYGLFINVFFNLLFVSFILYLLTKLINSIKNEMKKEMKKIENI